MAVTIQQKRQLDRVADDRPTGIEMDTALAGAQIPQPASKCWRSWKILGFERAPTGDIATLASDHQIKKIAIVADKKWESDALTFAGAGFRQGQVRFFPQNQLAQARAWVG
jgi:hypothetical protein